MAVHVPGLTVRNSTSRSASALALLVGSLLALSLLPAPIASARVSPVGNGKGTKGSGVTYAGNTVVIPKSVVAGRLTSVSADGSTYTFSSASGPLARLKAGKVMLLQGYAVRNVSSVARKSGKLVVQTTPAAITDLVRNGTLSWGNTPINLSRGYAVGGAGVPMTARDALTAPDLRMSSSARAEAALAERFGLRALAARAVTLKGKTKSYNFSVKFTSEGKAVGVAITISKSSPVELEATINGTLDNLSSSGSIGVKNAHLKSASLTANGLKGQFTLSYSIKPLSSFGLGTAGGIKITLPAELTVPFAVNGIPFFIGIKTAFFASVGFSGFNQAVSGSYTISYNGRGGFSTSSSGATSPISALKGIGKVILGAANAVSAGPLSIVFGAQVPQLELGLGVKGLNVAGFVTLIANTGVATFGSGCDTRGLLVQGSAGAEANFFGLSTSLGSATLFKKEVAASYPAGCGVFPGF